MDYIDSYIPSECGERWLTDVAGLTRKGRPIGKKPGLQSGILQNRDLHSESHFPLLAGRAPFR
jgi:hypothetical protein